MTSVRSLCQTILPIRVGIDPMERLLVASFRGDPEFEGFKPQIFDDAVNGKGMRVLRYRKDGRVDVYGQPGVRVDRSTFVVGAGIGDFAEVTIEPARFEITERGVDLHLAFTEMATSPGSAPGKSPAGSRSIFFPASRTCLTSPVVGPPPGGGGSGLRGVRITGGTYRASREDGRVAVELDVTEHWKPSGLPLSMEIFTRVVRTFRTWPATYRWRGVVELGATPTMSGEWERLSRR